MAIACFRLVTFPPFPPFPERSVPRFSRRNAFLTLSAAALPYFAMAFIPFRLIASEIGPGSPEDPCEA
jgi:hypothetical protein